MTKENCGRCGNKIKDSKYRESMHYGKIHNKCHDKMFADLNKVQENEKN